MPGTLLGGQKAATTIKKKYGKDYYARIGSMGGKLGRNGGFASKLVGEDGMTGQERTKVVGRLGGKISKRPKKVV